MESIRPYLQAPIPYESTWESPLARQWQTNDSIPKKARLALIGVTDERYERLSGKICAETPHAIRKAFLQLRFRHKFILPDIGDLVPGNTPKDTIFGLSEVVLQLLKHNLIPIIIGGGEDLIYGLYDAIQYRKAQVKHNHIDFTIDNRNLRQITSQALFTHIANDFPSVQERRFLGTQTYYCPDADFTTIGDTFQSKYRLGMLREDIFSAEPIFRDNTFTTIDMDAVRKSDHPANNLAMPNGLYAEEICQLAWFAGQSNTTGLFGIFNYTSHRDVDNQSATLIAQILWHFIDGYYSRFHDPAPSSRKADRFGVYFVNSSTLKKSFQFYKCPTTGRYWLLIENSRKKTKRFLPVSKNEYEDLTHDKISERIFYYLAMFEK